MKIKNFLIRLVACMPALGVAISGLLSLALSFDYPLFIFLTIMDALAFVILAWQYKKITSMFNEFFKTMLIYDDGD